MKNLLFLSSLAFFSLSITAQQKPVQASTILSAAYKQANQQQKNVLVIFHASWCGWCRKMDASINSPECKQLFAANYIIVHLTVHESKEKILDENPGAAELMKKYKAYEAGLPFWLVLDKEGNLLGDSFMKTANGKSANIGCPASEAEVAAFIKVIKATATLTYKELTAISVIFRKNEAD